MLKINLIPQMLKHTLILFSSGLALATTTNAAILAYDGFATDLTGSGDNYEDGVILEGVDKTRLGFTGVWTDTGSGLSSDVNSRADLTSLSYPNFNTGEVGSANAYRDGQTAGSNKWLGRSLNISSGDVTGGYYVAALIDINGAEGGGFGFGIPGRDYYFELDGANTATFQSAGSFGDNSGALALNGTGTNLIVIQYTNDTSGSAGNQNNAFYTRWNVWVNPDLTNGNLGTVTATGFGIGLLNNNVVTAPSEAILSSSNLDAGESIYVDEFYITTSPSDFVIPEPSTYALLAGVAMLGLAIYRRRQ